LPLKIFIARQTTRAPADLQQFFMFRPIRFFLFEAEKTLLRKRRPQAQSPPHLTPVRTDSKSKSSRTFAAKIAQSTKKPFSKERGKKIHPKKEKRKKRRKRKKQKTPPVWRGFR